MSAPPPADPDPSGRNDGGGDSPSEIRDHLANLGRSLGRKDSTLETSSGSEGEDDALIDNGGSRKVSREEQPQRKSEWSYSGLA